MIRSEDHLDGAPCWVETLQPDPGAALEFYRGLLGWDFGDPGPPAGRGGDEHFTARLHGHPVAGIGPTLPDWPASWMLHVRVVDLARATARVEAAGGRVVAPREASEGGRVALVADATGVPFHLREGGAPAGAPLVGEPGTWAMSSLHTADVEAAEHFYGAVLGWELNAVPGAPFSRWELSGQVLGLVVGTDGASVPQHWSINLAVRDADRVAGRAVSLGGTTVLEPFDTPGFRSTVVADPQGAVIAFSAPTEW